MARAQGKHGEFGINWSVATLFFFSSKKVMHAFPILSVLTTITHRFNLLVADFLIQSRLLFVHG